MQNLTVALIQTNLFWENPTANLAMLEEKIAGIKQPVDLIVLPEMFTTGFSMQVSATAEHMNQATHRWMKQMAQRTQAVITGSVAIKQSEGCVNRLLWVTPDGQTQYYDKRHLYRMGLENENFVAGNERPIFEWKGWKICPIICYDLRFPVWSRNANLRYDILLNVASWPSSRKHVWQTLLPARAIENLAYAIGVNRVGVDGLAVEHSGLSAAYDFKGFALNQPHSQEEVILLTLDKEALVQFRTNFPAYADADDFEIKI